MPYTIWSFYVINVRYYRETPTLTREKRHVSNNCGAYLKNGLFLKLAYFKNRPILKISLFQKLAYFKIFAGAIIIGNVTFFPKKTP